MYALIHSVGAMFVWMTLNGNSYVSLASGWWMGQIEVFIPVFIGWLMVSFFDGAFMRETFGEVVFLSVFGPFALHWWNLAQFFLAGEGRYLDELTFWLYFAFYAAYTIVQMIVDVILLPQVFEWTESSNIMENDADEDYDNLFSKLFKF